MTRATAVTADVLPWAKETFKDVPNAAGGAGGKHALAIPPDAILLHPKWTQMNADVVTPAFNEIWDGKQNPSVALKAIKPSLQGMVE